MRGDLAARVRAGRAAAAAGMRGRSATVTVGERPRPGSIVGGRDPALLGAAAARPGPAPHPRPCAGCGRPAALSRPAGVVAQLGRRYPPAPPSCVSVVSVPRSAGWDRDVTRRGPISVGDDLRGQGHHGQAAAGVGGATDQEQAAHRAAVGRAEQPGRGGGAVDGRRVQVGGGPGLAEHQPVADVDPPRRRARRGSGRRTRRRAPGASPVDSVRCGAALTSTNHASCPAGRAAGSSATVTNTVGSAAGRAADPRPGSPKTASNSAS